MMEEEWMDELIWGWIWVGGWIWCFLALKKSLKNKKYKKIEWTEFNETFSSD